ncbi:carboxypeptidase-like regulatory domain-containing protein [Pandoraea cepalis]|nr:carboxypeptidase-like regulatory domain-containing protein [Pandoraea cepalis]
MTSINTQTSATGHSGSETDMGRIVMSRSARVSLFVPLFAWLCMIGVALAASTPQPESESGVSYITGGIGEDEVQVFRAAAPQYNLRMTFTSTSGSYLSDVDVTITAGAGRHVLAVRTEGPFLFVRMPAGDYRVSVHTPARSESRNIRVPKRGAVDLHFSWDDPDAPAVLHLCKQCPRPHRR